MVRTLVLSALVAGLASFAHLSTASAHSYHTAEVCAATNKNVCAHLGSNAEPNSTDESVFMLHFMSKTFDPKLLSNVSVKLWMDSMGHGSSPVTLVQKDEAHFEVSKAFFVMPGTWQVKVAFAYNGANHEIVIPVNVK